MVGKRGGGEPIRKEERSSAKLAFSRDFSLQ